MTVIQQRDVIRVFLRKAAFTHVLRRGHFPQVRGFVVRDLLGGLVGNQQLHHHAAGLLFAGLIRCHDHPFGGFTNTAGRQRPFAFNSHHTGPTIAVRPVAGRGFMAQMRDDKAAPVGHLPDGFTRCGGYGFPVQFECDAV